MGQSPSSSNYTKNPNDNILVQGNADMVNGKVSPRVWTTQITKMAQKGDIILSVRAPVGDVGITDYDVVLGRGVAGIRADEFIYQILKKMKLFNYWNRLSTGSTFESISSIDIKNAENLIPSKSEQNLIGNFLKIIDTMTDLQQVQLQLYKNLKNGLLQKLFPSNTEKTPILRFADFDGDWEQRKLGEVLNLLKDGTHGSHKDTSSGAYLLSAKNIKNGKVIINDDTDRRISKKEFDSIHKKFSLKKGDVLLTIVGSIGESAILNDPTNITFQRSVAYLRPNKYLLSQFLYITINEYKFQTELTKRQVVSAQPGIYLGDLSIIPIKVPSMKEQIDIGDLFKIIDNLINRQQTKLEHLKLIKKFYLKKMFI